MAPLHVLIIGGGIGGLCLAQGLRRADIRVTVYERHRSRTDWLQGYRIHINPHGSRALHRCLEPDTWQAFLATVSDEAGTFAFMTEQMRTLLTLDADLVGQNDPDPANQHHGVSRITLREVLLAGLDDVIEFDRTFGRYELTPGGRVTAHFSDGPSATGDLLVGADGANSRVRQQLLPQAGRIDTGVVAVAGKRRLDGAAGAPLPAELATRVNSVLPSRRGSLFTAVWRGDRRAAATARVDDGGFLFDNTTDYVFWAYADAAAQFPRLDGWDGARIQQLILDKISTWNPELRRMVAESDPATVNALTIRSATPVEPWPTGPVTLLGDAIHNMTPMGGIGANTALRDAELLARQLRAVHEGGQTLLPAVHEYERQMLDYGFAAVKASLRNARLAASASPATRAAFRTTLRVAEAVPAIKRRMFADIGQ
jgi:salicylate hydroxylase